MNQIKEHKELVKSYITDLYKSKGEGSRGGKVIGHTKSGKPIYEGGEHHEIIQSSFNLRPERHLNTAKQLRAKKSKLKRELDEGKYGSGATANLKLREYERRARIHEEVAYIKQNMKY